MSLQGLGTTELHLLPFLLPHHLLLLASFDGYPSLEERYPVLHFHFIALLAGNQLLVSIRFIPCIIGNFLRI